MSILGDVLERVDRSLIVEDDIEYKCVGVRWYGLGTFIREIKSGINITRKQQWVIKSGDVVYNKLFAWKGAFAVANDEVNDCIVSDKFPTYKHDPIKVDIRYLHYYFQTPTIARDAELLSKGAAAISKLTLNPPDFLKLTIPLPKLSEQERIVKKIKEIEDRIKDAHHIREKSIREMETIIDSKISKILEINKNNSNWEFGPIPQFAEVNPPRNRKQDNFSSDLPVSFVSMKAVDEEDGIIASPETKIFAEASKGHTRFQNGDVIFARITPCMENGKSALAEELENGIGFGSTEFHVLRPSHKISGRWLHTLVRHKEFKTAAKAQFKGTAGQQRVPKSFLENRIIAVPPIPEQNQIIIHLEKIRNSIKTLKCLQNETLYDVERLFPSILQKAFNGKL